MHCQAILTDRDACLECVAILRGVEATFYCDVHETSSEHWRLWLVFLESCGCGPLATDEESSEELPETDIWQFVEAHSRWGLVRVVVHPLTADSRMKALRRDMVWRVRESVTKRVLRAATLQSYLRLYSSNSPQAALQPLMR